MDNAVEILFDRLESRRGAVVSRGQRVEAAELLGRARGLMGWLQRKGVKPGDRALLLVPPGPELASALLAIVGVGAVPVLIEAGSAPAAWVARVAAVAPPWAIVDPRLATVWRIPGLASVLRWRGVTIPPAPKTTWLVLPEKIEGEGALIPRSAADEAMLLFTSGTTSAPRAVVHTHGSLPGFLAGVEETVAGLAVGSYLAETPQQIFYALLLGSTCHVVSGSGEQRLRDTLAVLRSGEVEAWFGSPWTWTRWMAGGWPVPPQLRTVLLGSAPITRTFLRRLLPVLPKGTTVRGVYGLTEAGPVSAFDGAEKAAREKVGDWVGHPLAGVRASLDDNELRVFTPGLARGYLGQAPFGEWLYTGDIGSVEGDGGLVVWGRVKDMIIRRGVNHYPSLLEEVLAPYVAESALIGVYDGQAADERVILAVVGPPPSHLTALLGDAAPDHILRLEKLPRSGRQSKVDKVQLRELARVRFDIPY